MNTEKPITSSEITLARMLVAYDAWEPEEDDSDAALTLDEFTDVLCDYLEPNEDDISAPNNTARALIDRVRKAGLL